MKQDTIINVGLIGFGNAGRLYHAPFLNSVPGFRLAKVRTTRAVVGQALNALPAHTQIVTDNDAILQDPSIDLVVVAAPNHLHFPLAKAALEAGKHVVVDKPFTLSTAEADELIAVAGRSGRLLTVYHNRRLTSDFRTLKKVCASGLLGRIVEYESHFDRFRNTIRHDSWKEEDMPGAGIFYDMGPHLIDQTLQLFGTPLELRADLRVQRTEGRVIDSFEVVLLYEGLKATLKGGMLVKDPFPQFAVFGEQGSFVKYGRDMQEDALRDGEIPNARPDWGTEPESFWGRLITHHQGLELTATVKSEQGDYSVFYRNLHRAITAGAELLVQPQEARDVIYLIELAEQSSREKRTLPVQPRGAAQPATPGAPAA
ncbi:oxidoreductase [Hymenobacter gummosus]|uniref:Oxidoreductase n=1 Tax=Hymenobacter gummosus TaxID=1776032 RepID=A0A431U4B1_9BACT|nr:Gfo/Idh/MocA family oxidoreductase [Hymenobacter gummosus]RTQ50614.1 oxidoreductase [Hymenobacter gummosus]